MADHNRTIGNVNGWHVEITQKDVQAAIKYMDEHSTGDVGESLAIAWACVSAMSKELATLSTFLDLHKLGTAYDEYADKLDK